MKNVSLWSALLIISALQFSMNTSFAEPSASQQTERPSCKVCGMYIDEFKATAAEATLKNGEKFEVCGVACLIRFINDQGGPDAFTSIKVTDWDTKDMIPANGAAYVIGSNVIPDMMPNIIAFKNKSGAEAFMAKRGGEHLDFTQALLSVSPMGMTMPTRIKSAVVPPKGSLAVGSGYMHMVMNKVKIGSETVDPYNFAHRPGQMMGPKKMISDAEMVMANYGLTDDLSLGISEAYYQKEMQTYKMGGAVTETTENKSPGDVDVNLRYGLWRNVYYSKFLTLLAGTTMPTGDFDTKYISMPGMQTGTGSFTFTGGMLYSQRYSDFWFHSMASYNTILENSDDYKFGDTTRAGVALHYTPNYDVLTGIELDGAWYAKDKYNDDNQNSTGGFRSNVSAVWEWRFLTALGGNFSLRAVGGIPVYEDINHFKVGQSEKVKMGSGYFVTGMINFSRRFPVYSE